MDTQLNGETLREKEMLVKLLFIRHTMDAHTHTHTHTHTQVVSLEEVEELSTSDDEILNHT